MPLTAYRCQGGWATAAAVTAAWCRTWPAPPWPPAATACFWRRTRGRTRPSATAPTWSPWTTCPPWSSAACASGRRSPGREITAAERHQGLAPMSSDEPQTAPLWKNWKLVSLAAALVVTVIVFPLLIVGSSQTKTTAPSDGKGPAEDNSLETARAALQRQTDFTTCRAALQQINAHLSAGKCGPRAGLPPDRAERLRGLFGLDPGELDE